jgi:hypothetical protein
MPGRRGPPGWSCHLRLHPRHGAIAAPHGAGDLVNALPSLQQLAGLLDTLGVIQGATEYLAVCNRPLKAGVDPGYNLLAL